jgi:hypothetical protein
MSRDAGKKSPDFHGVNPDFPKNSGVGILDFEWWQLMR